MAPPPIPGGAGALEDVDLCQAPGDYFGSGSRAAIAQLLRAQLEARTLTPTELLHDHKSLTAILGQKVSIEAAIDRVAAIQAKLPGQDLRNRRAAIRTAVDEAQARAAKADRILEGLAKKGQPLAVLQREGMRFGDSEEQDHLLRCALARELIGIQGWVRKLAFLLALAGDDSSGRTAALVDGVIADLVSAGAILNELFGPTPQLGVGLRRNIDLAITELPRPSDAAQKPQYALNALLFAGRLPETRAILLDRARRQLRTTQPLGSGRRDEEIRAFHEILVALVTADGVAGGGGMAEALVARYSRRLDQGGATGLRLSMQGIVEALPNLFCRLQFLAALASSDMGVKSISDLVQMVETLGSNTMLLESAVFRPFDPQGLRAGLERAACAFEQTGYPGETKARLRQKIVGLVDNYAQRGGLLEAMDKAEPVVERRVAALSAMIAADMFTPLGGQPSIEHRIAQLGGKTVAQPTVTLASPGLGAGAGPYALSSATVTLPFAGQAGASTVLLNAPATVQMRASTGFERRAGMHIGPRRCSSCFETKADDGMCMVCGFEEGEASRSLAHLRPGTALEGRYVVGRLIGQGGFGATYLGWDERLEVKVAIKEYFPLTLATRSTTTGALVPFTADQAELFNEGVGKFLEEARLLARLRDVKEIVKVHDQFEANATAYMVMELLVGRTLQRHLLEEGGSIDYRRALGVMLPIAKAVHHVHQLGLVHRDISPDNIFLLDRGEPKLLDFGAARHSVGEVTGALTVILKRGYAPPEQYSSDGKQGPWTDVYALCATFYCAITGRPPPDATARWGDDTILARPSRLGINIPVALEDVLLSGLTLRWQDRPRDMIILLQNLNRALS